MSVTLPWTASDDTPVNGVVSKVDEVRQALSKEAEHLAELAAKHSRDAADQVSGIADAAATNAGRLAKDATAKAQSVASDPAAQASSWVDRLVKALAGLGTAFALSGRNTADDLSTNAKSVADDLSKLRLTTQPKKTSPDFTPGITLLAGFGAGIALMYFLDPERGRQRRNMVRDRLMSLTRARSTADDFASDETQTWDTDTYGTSDDVLETSEYTSPTGFVTADPSTTDTWGTQPQTSGATEIDIR